MKSTWWGSEFSVATQPIPLLRARKRRMDNIKQKRAENGVKWGTNWHKMKRYIWHIWYSKWAIDQRRHVSKWSELPTDQSPQVHIHITSLIPMSHKLLTLSMMCVVHFNILLMNFFRVESRQKIKRLKIHPGLQIKWNSHWVEWKWQWMSNCNTQNSARTHTHTHTHA